MLTFLRKIRKGLIEGGASSKYLLYALGEIALVVIGILIALQLNNWNEERKNNAIKQEYVKIIIEELDINIARFERFYKVQDRRMKKFQNFFDVINNESSTLLEINQATDSLQTFVGISGIRFNTISELLESGNLVVFEREVREEIIDYKNDFEFQTALFDNELKEVRRLKSEWYSSIDLAYYQGLRDRESQITDGWKTDLNSLPFMKSTNFYSYRYTMASYSKDFFEWTITRTEKLKSALSKSQNPPISD